MAKKTKKATNQTKENARLIKLRIYNEVTDPASNDADPHSFAYDNETNIEYSSDQLESYLKCGIERYEEALKLLTDGELNSVDPDRINSTGKGIIENLSQLRFYAKARLAYKKFIK